MSSEPPPFQEAPRCDVCKCSFNTFRRRHHCRSCGRTLCHEHSSDQMALPQFGIHSTVRVCSDCFNNSSRSGKVDPNSIGAVTDSFSRLDFSVDVNEKTEPTVVQLPVVNTPECKCGMPLCICEAPTPTPAPDLAPLEQLQTTSTSQYDSRPKKTNPLPKSAGSASKRKPSSLFNIGQVTNGGLDNPVMDYEVNGEGLREAIKNSDITAVKKLLSEGVDANYQDKQGLSLLHLAALFNHTEIVFALMDFGASLDSKNAQGETPLDCAPTMLQFKMRKRIEEGA